VSGRGALALTVANLVAGLLNYLFLVHAAAVLDAPAFGELSAWLARVTAIGVVATVVQFVSLDFRIGDRPFATLLRLAGLVSIALAVLHVALGAHAPLVLLAVSAVAGGTVLYAAVGQLQARLRLGAMAATVTSVAVLRFVLPFLWSRDGRAPAFPMAHAAAAYAGLATAALVVTVHRVKAAPPAATRAAGSSIDTRARLGRSIVLAFASVLFPLLDVLVVSATQSAAVTGEYSRIALAARVVFFGGAAALQILLPHQLHAVSTGEAPPSFVALMQRWLVPVGLAGALVLAAVVDHGFLHPAGEARIWLYVSCLAAALLVGILDTVNQLAARGRVGLVLGCVAAVVLANALAATLGHLGGEHAVTRFAVGALAGEALVLVLARMAQMRARSGAA
jgi:hypothetical protein